MSQKISRHGTLSGNDMKDAVPIDLDQVMRSTKTPSTKHLFGGAGVLPPKAAQQVERRYVEIWRIMEEGTEQDWVGLTTFTNDTKGVFTKDLQPGEYKLCLSLPKELNKNLLFGSISGTVVGGLGSLLQQDSEKSEEIYSRGLPNMYADVRLSVQSKKYAVLDVSGILDLGIHEEFTKTFSVREVDTPATLRLKVESHTTLKRLKLKGVLYRRDFEEKKIGSRRLPNKQLSTEGRKLLSDAFESTDSETQINNKSNGIIPKICTRLDSNVDLHRFLSEFYEIYAPSKLDDVDMVLEHFAGREDDLIESLESKYKVRFDRTGNVI